MQESPATRASLLVRLRDGGDADAWQEFVAPVRARHLRLRPQARPAGRRRRRPDAGRAPLRLAARPAGSTTTRAAAPFAAGCSRSRATRSSTSSTAGSRRVQASGDSRVQERLEQHADGDGDALGRLGSGLSAAAGGAGDGAGQGRIPDGDLAGVLADGGRRACAGPGGRPASACRSAPSTSPRAASSPGCGRKSRRMQGDEP